MEMAHDVRRGSLEDREDAARRVSFPEGKSEEIPTRLGMFFVLIIVSVSHHHVENNEDKFAILIIRATPLLRGVVD